MLSITLKQLEFFITIVETKSFSKTADLLSFSQPAISSNIALLEDTLQTELLDRTNKKRIEITEDGMFFYEKAKEILANCYTLQDIPQQKNDSDMIAIGAHVIPAHYMLMDVMNFYKKSHPSIRFLLKEGSDFDVMNLLDQRKVDLGFVSQLSGGQTWKALPIYGDSIIIGMPNTPRYQCLRMKKPSVYELLKKEKIIWNQSLDTLVCDYLEQFGIQKESLNIIGEMNSEQLAKTAVIDGLGISFLSNISLKCAVKSAEILTYELPDPPVRTIKVVYSQNKWLNKAGKDFVDFLNSKTFDFEKCNR